MKTLPRSGELNLAGPFKAGKNCIIRYASRQRRLKDANFTGRCRDAISIFLVSNPALKGWAKLNRRCAVTRLFNH